MPNSFFQFKKFTVHQDRSAMKVTTDACLFGAWVAKKVKSQNPKVKTVLEIGAGTGLLSLMIAQQSSAMIDAIEIDVDAEQQAKENMDRSPWPDRFQVIHGDAREYPYVIKYDLIISNPPFYEKEIMSDKETKNIAHHSSALSLKELLSIITSNLAEQGRFFLLLPYKRNKEVINLLKQQSFAVEKIVFIRQSVNHHYFRMMIEGCWLTSKSTEIQFEDLSIWNEGQDYTVEFKLLLKEYYLKL